MRICMVIFNYIGPPDYSYGGAETGTFRLCEELVREGVDIEVCHYSSNPQDRVWKKQHLRQFGKKAFGVMFPKFPVPLSLMGALRRADADVYHSQLNGVFAAFPAAYCKFTKKPYCLTMRASDCMVTTEPGWKKKILFFPPKTADQTFVTYDHQVSEVQESYGVTPIVAPDPLEVSEVESSGKNVLFVNRLVPVKRPMMFVELAKKIDYNFEIVGYGALEKQVRAASPKNLKFTGKLTPAQTRERYKEAAVTVTTSTFEGVPCVWLESWACGVPVVSTVDRGNMLTPLEELDSKSKGISVRDDQIEEAVRLLVEDEKLRKQLGKNGRGYVKTKHDPERIAKLHIRTYEKLLG